MTDRPVAPSTEALAFLVQYHGFQAEQIHKEQVGGLHSGESWNDCPSLICRNARWDIEKALAIEAEARATALDRLGRALDAHTAAVYAIINPSAEHQDHSCSFVCAADIWARLSTGDTE